MHALLRPDLRVDREMTLWPCTGVDGCRWYVCVLSTTKGHELSDFHMLFLGQDLKVARESSITCVLSFFFSRLLIDV